MKTNTKGSLIASLFSFALLTVTMVIGGSFAWFTSKSENKDNVIKVGRLQVGLYNEEGTSPIFDATEEWEPSESHAQTLTVKNEGTINAIYGITLGGLDEIVGASDILEYFEIYIDDEYRGTLKNYEVASVGAALHIGNIDAGETETFELGIKFVDEATNENVMYPELEFSIILNATQAINTESGYVLFPIL